MRTHFHTELEQLRGMLERLSSDVGTNVEQACKALIDTDASLTGRVEHLEMRVDFQEVRVEEECLKIIALHQPVADELRYLAAAMQVNYALERLSDLSEYVVKEIGIMSPDAVSPYQNALSKIATRLQEMLAEAMVSFRRSDAGLAREVWQGNTDYQRMCRAVIGDLRAQVTARSGGEETALALMEAAFNLARMGAHIADIAKSVLYLVLGHVVRHRSREFQRSGTGGKTRVLFVCIHNSARSRMAEAWLNTLHGDRYEAESAGLTPGVLNPFAVQAMRDVGIDISAMPPRSVEDAITAGRAFDYVITVCDDASAERCPPVLGIAEQMQWEFDDPAALTGSDAEKLDQVRRIRDAIRLKIDHWVSAISEATA